MTRLAAACVAVLLAVGTAGGQQLEGVALGPDGEPLVGANILLHGVGAGGGSVAGADTTDADGAFSFPLPADSAVYFAAVRYEGTIYVGPAAQAFGESVTGYVLQVGPSSEVGAVGAALADPGRSSPGLTNPGPAGQTPARPGRTGRSSSDTGALWLVSLLALAAAAVFLVTAPRYRHRRTLDAVIEVAEIENRLEDEAATLAADEVARLEEHRDRLKGQLAPTG